MARFSKLALGVPSSVQVPGTSGALGKSPVPLGFGEPEPPAHVLKRCLRGLREAPNDEGLLSAAANAFLAQRKLAAAQRVLEALEMLVPDSRPVTLLKARLHRARGLQGEKGELDKAIALLSKLRERDQREPRILTELCEAWAAVHQYKAALNNLRMVLDQGDYWPARRLHAEVFAERSLDLPRDRAAARTELEALAKLAPRDAVVHRALGRLCLQEGAWDQAETSLRQAIDIRAWDEASPVLLAALHYRRDGPRACRDALALSIYENRAAAAGLRLYRALVVEGVATAKSLAALFEQAKKVVPPEERSSIAEPVEPGKGNRFEPEAELLTRICSGRILRLPTARGLTS